MKKLVNGFTRKIYSKSFIKVNEKENAKSFFVKKASSTKCSEWCSPFCEFCTNEFSKRRTILSLTIYFVSIFKIDETEMRTFKFKYRTKLHPSPGKKFSKPKLWNLVLDCSSEFILFSVFICLWIGLKNTQSYVSYGRQHCCEQPTLYIRTKTSWKQNMPDQDLSPRTTWGWQSEQRPELPRYAFKITVGRQFFPSGDSSQATIHPKFQKATNRPECKKRQFVPYCLIDQLINNLKKIEIKEFNK